MGPRLLGTLDGDLTRHQDRAFLEAVIGVCVFAALADDRVHRVELLAINSRLATENGSTLHVVAVCLNRIGKVGSQTWTCLMG